MRRTVLLLAFVTASVLGASSVASAEPELGPGCTVDSAEGTVSGYKLAQTFVADKSGTIPKLWIAAYAYGTDFAIKVTTVDAEGRPTDNVLAGHYVPVPPPGGEPVHKTWITFGPDSESAAPEVVAGQTYAIVADTGNPSNPFGYLFWQNTRTVDCEGYSWLYFPPNGGPSDMRAYDDFLFQTYIDPSDTVAPTGRVTINGDKPRTASRAVTLGLNATDPAPSSGLDSMRLKNAGGSWTAWQPYAASKDWKLTRGGSKKTVYAQYRDAAGNVSAKASDSITYRP